MWKRLRISCRQNVDKLAGRLLPWILWITSLIVINKLFTSKLLKIIRLILLIHISTGTTTTTAIYLYTSSVLLKQSEVQS